MSTRERRRRTRDTMPNAFADVNMTHGFHRAIMRIMEVDPVALADSYVGEWVRCNRFDAIEARPFTEAQVERWLRDGRPLTTPEGIGPALAFAVSGTILLDD